LLLKAFLLINNRMGGVWKDGEESNSDRLQEASSPPEGLGFVFSLVAGVFEEGVDVLAYHAGQGCVAPLPLDRIRAPDHLSKRSQKETS